MFTCSFEARLLGFAPVHGSFQGITSPPPSSILKLPLPFGLQSKPEVKDRFAIAKRRPQTPDPQTKRQIRHMTVIYPHYLGLVCPLFALFVGLKRYAPGVWQFENGSGRLPFWFLTYFLPSLMEVNRSRKPMKVQA